MKVKNLNQRLNGLAAKLASRPQAQTRQSARSLYQILEAPLQIFARLCPALCPSCPEACCRRVSQRGVMDTADLIFIAAQGLSALPQAVGRDGRCPWLGEEGCILPWNARPFACLHYVCAPLQNAMSPIESEQIRASLAQAGDARSRLLKLFMEP